MFAFGVYFSLLIDRQTCTEAAAKKITIKRPTKNKRHTHARTHILYQNKKQSNLILRNIKEKNRNHFCFFSNLNLNGVGRCAVCCVKRFQCINCHCLPSSRNRKIIQFKIKIGLNSSSSWINLKHSITHAISVFFRIQKLFTFNQAKRCTCLKLIEQFVCLRFFSSNYKFNALKSIATVSLQNWLEICFSNSIILGANEWTFCKLLSTI